MKSKQRKEILFINDHHARTGIGIYAFKIFEIFRSMEDSKYSFYMLIQNMKKKHVKSLPGIPAQFRPFYIKGGNFDLTYDLLSYFYFPKVIPKGYSIYHISNQMMGNSVRYVHPTVITCHDIIPFKFRKNHNVLTEYIRRKNIIAMTKAAFIIFVSNSTKKDFLELLNYNESKTAVVYHGVSKVFKTRDKMSCRKELGLSSNRPIILHVGTEAPRKNPEVIYHVIKKIKKHITDILLIRIGPKRPETEDIVRKLSLSENVSYFGSLSEERLAKFYNAADVFLFPSFYEGFGLPVLEALKSGCPLVASNATSIPEITGDAAFLHDPMDVDSFAASVEKLLEDQSLREEYIAKGLTQARKFSWENTAQKTLEVYDKV